MIDVLIVNNEIKAKAFLNEIENKNLSLSLQLLPPKLRKSLDSQLRVLILTLPTLRLRRTQSLLLENVNLYRVFQLHLWNSDTGINYHFSSSISRHTRAHS